LGHHLTDGPAASLALAARALELVGADPAEAHRCASLVIAGPRGRRYGAARSMANRALALHAWEHADAQLATRYGDASVREAEHAGDADLSVDALATLAVLRCHGGRPSGALSLLDRADAIARPAKLGKVRMHRAMVVHQLGDFRQAFDLCASMHRDGLELSAVDSADAHANLGVFAMDLGRLDEAEQAFLAAEAAYGALGKLNDAADMVANRAMALTRAGRLPEALQAFHDAGAQLDALGAPVGWLLIGQAQAFTAANLHAEAHAASRQAVAHADRAAPIDQQGEAWLRLASSALQAGDAGEAVVAARTARRRYARLDAPARLATADHLLVRADVAAGRPARGLLTRALQVADRLVAAGQVGQAVEARTLAVELAIGIDDLAEADRQAALVRPHRMSGTAVERLSAWRAEALVGAATGDRRRTVRAVQSGLRVLDQQRATFGATELQVQAAGHGEQLARIGLDVALRSGRAADVLSAVERWRAGALRPRPPITDDVVAELAALRQVLDEIEEVARVGGDAAPLLRRQARHELRVRALTLGRRGDGDAVAALGPADIRAALADRALIELFVHDDRLHALTLTGGRWRHVALCPITPVRQAMAELAFALRRLGRPRGSSGALAAARAGAEASLALLDELVIRPVQRSLGAAEVVVVPPSELFGLPFSALPSLVGRSVTVAPSVRWWAGRPRATPSDAVALIAGPDLAGASAEVDAITAHHRDALVLTGESATTERVTAALDGAGLAHLACHGRFRTDNPMFSALKMSDGPLTVYDLERLRRAPTNVVLSACDSGVSASRPGDEMLGLLTALFSLGTSAVVASVVPVPDLDTSALMIDLHRRLAAGHGLARALTDAQLDLDRSSPTGFVTAVAFGCFGAG
jgi:tetratricopeptide (TPR) repeat protein